MIVRIVCLLLIILLIFVVIHSTCKLCKYSQYLQENFGDPVLVKTTPDILDLTQQFDDLIVYDNDPNGRIGLDKCIENCQGYCVEFGQTGSAYCFPERERVMKNFDGVVVQNDGKISFPNVDR